MSDDSVKHVPNWNEEDIDIDALRDMGGVAIIDHEKTPNSAYEIDFDTPTMFSMVNGAKINPEKSKAFIRLERANEDGSESAWTMKLEQGDRLGDFLDRVPFGVIDKTITGLGATTLELCTQVRDSIIVVPTKSLAYNKHIWGETALGDGSSMYVGSAIKSIRTSVAPKEIRRYLAIDNGKRKKFLVVADSLGKVIEAIGERVYRDYFLMVDEIDTMQSDSPYRPNLERVIDYYFKFDRANRSCVTATLKHFSNDALSKESYVTTIWENQPTRNITLIHTNYVDDVAVNRINDLLQKSEEDKILVAYNSIDGILNIIGQLDEAAQTTCGILCSERSYAKTSDFLGEDVIDGVLDETNHLQKRIVFLTCSYFAGIDIEDRCHLISISTHNQPYTLLSTGRMAQIAGRCRNGLLSEQIIYDTEVLNSGTTEEAFREKLLQKAGKISRVLSDLSALAKEDEDFAEFEKFAESFLEFKAKGKVAETYSMAVVRKSIDGQYVPAFFNIDAMLEKFNLHHELYFEMGALLNALKADGHNVALRRRYIKKEKHPTETLSAIKDRNAQRQEENLLKAKQDIVEWLETGGKYWHDFEAIKRAEIKDKEVEKLYERFGKFYGYIDPIFLLDKLIENRETDAFTRFNNSLAFWLLEESHPFKAHVLAEFQYHTLATMRRAKPGIRITTASKRGKMLEILKLQLSLKVSEQWASELFSCFFKTTRSGGLDKIIGLNPERFPEPIKHIGKEAKLLQLFEIPYNY